MSDEVRTCPCPLLAAEGFRLRRTHYSLLNAQYFSMPLIRSISGLRGTLGDGLTPDIVVRYVSAFADYTGGGPIIVGHDGRPSGAWIQQVVIGTLIACGVEVRVLGMAPTPTVQMAVEKSDAVGGISITASHNPAQWNGLKFLNGNGVFPGPKECEELFAIVDRAERPYADHNRLGTIIPAEHLIQGHVDAVLALPFLDHEALRKRRFTVVVDAVNASGSTVVPTLLETLGCTVIPLFCDGSGAFPHTPEPLPENLNQLCDAVRKHGADLGIAVDPDADRLVLIDERGEPFGEEYTITQAADFMLAWARENAPERKETVVVNLSTTRAVQDVAERYGAELIRTQVGEINVVEGMKESGALIGGEGSGGIILADLHYGRDSLVGIAITLSNLLKQGNTLSALRAALPQYEIVKTKAEIRKEENLEEIFHRVRNNIEGAKNFSTVDGLRIDFERSWVHLRGSNTEPIMRVIAEAPTRDEAEKLIAMVQKAKEEE